MSTSTRFAVATHILTSLAHFTEPLPSEELAKSVGTSAVVVRQMIGRLQAAGLVRSRLGKGGGSLLAMPAAEISLLTVYQAVERPDFFAHHTCSDETCPVSRHLLDVLRPITKRAERALYAELAAVTIAEVHDEVFAK